MIVFLLLGIGVIVSAKPSDTDLECYVCTSYMDQCKERVEGAYVEYVHKTKCQTKCFIRKAEDDALYRGCFDGFKDATGLSYDFVGCRNVTWNNKALPWCLCDSPLCNEQSMYELSSYKSSYKSGEEEPYLEEPYDSYDSDAGYLTKDIGYGKYETGFNEDIQNEEYHDVKEINHARGYEYGYQNENYVESNHQQPDQYSAEEKYGDKSDPYNQGYDEPEERYREGKTGDSRYGFKDSYKQAEHDEHDDYRPPYNSDRYANTPYGQLESQPYFPYSENDQFSKSAEDNSYVKREDEGDGDQTDASIFPKHLVGRIQCSKTGFYQNPDDCRTFVACVHDPHSSSPYMHLMRCPDGLVWDNKDKICMEYSTTCNVGGAYPDETQPKQVDDEYSEQTEPIKAVDDTYGSEQQYVTPDDYTSEEEHYLSDPYHKASDNYFNENFKHF